MFDKKKILLIALLLCLYHNSFCQIKKLTIEYPVVINGAVSEFNLLYESDTSFNTSATLRIYQTDRLIDSSLFQQLIIDQVKFEKGLKKLNLKKRWNTQQTNKQKKILTYINNFPPGTYVSMLRLKNGQQFTSHWHVDSQISAGARLNTEISESIQNSLRKIKGSKNNIKKMLDRAKQGAYTPIKKQEKAQQQINTKVTQDILKKVPSIRIKTALKGNVQRLSFYYDRTYLGYKEINAKKEIAAYASARINKTKDQIRQESKKQLSDYRTLFEQYKQKRAERMKEDGLDGNVSVDTYFDSDQEEFSPNDNIYSEIFADTKMKILGIPVQLEGYYTTQDRNRNIKASYLRLQYDVQSSKEELESDLQQFKSDYANKKSNLFAKQSIYGSYIDKLKGSKTTIINGLKSEIDLEDLSNFDWDEIGNNPFLFDQIDTNQLIQQLSEKASTEFSTSGKVNNEQQKVADQKAKAQEKIKKTRKRIEQLKNIEEKVRKYSAMIQQMQQTVHFDSAFVMRKLQNESDLDDYSKNSLLNKSKELLPKNDYSKFTKGLKDLNIGILNQYESDYSLAGQTMKGGGIEYSIKGVDFGVSIGRTEYVSRDLSNLDTYNNLLAKVTYEVSDKQRVKFIYYTYKPSNKHKANTFFSSLRNSQLSFNRPVHIGNIIYNGTVSKTIDYRFEIAGSRQKQTGDLVTLDPSIHQLAYKGTLAYTPVKLPLGFNIEYEKVGKNFTNETLAFIRRNFETKGITTFGEFFKGYLRARVSFKQLTQNPGEDQLRKNTKWGFDVRTVSKRYPNLQLSYKPFTTFASAYDTFAVSQRNLFGEVIRGKASYQLKKAGKSHRWHLLFNRNRTNIDTVNYETDLMQAGYILNSNSNMYMLQVGRMQMPENLAAPTNNRENYFVRMNEQFNVQPNIPLQLGQELAWNQGRINRLGVQVGSAYKLNNKPLVVRLQFRYLTYRNSANLMQNIYGSMLGITYNFKLRKK